MDTDDIFHDCGIAMGPLETVTPTVLAQLLAMEFDSIRIHRVIASMRWTGTAAMDTYCITSVVGEKLLQPCRPPPPTDTDADSPGAELGVDLLSMYTAAFDSNQADPHPTNSQQDAEDSEVEIEEAEGSDGVE